MEEEFESVSIFSRHEGYDYDFVEKLDPKFECAICLLALRSPHQTVCGHRFCKDCIGSCIVNGNSLCPVDNNPLTLNDVFPDTCVEREILDLKVFCPSHIHGCKRTVCLRDLQPHLQACQYQVVLCPNHCASTVLTGELQQHLLETCMMRSTRCNLCGAVYTFDKEQFHRAVCGDVEIQCESCSATCKRAQLSEHIATNCPETDIVCFYSEFGCSKKCRRADMETHIKNCMPEHLQLISSAYRKMNTFVSELSRTVGLLHSPSFSRQPSLRSQLSASSPVLVDQISEEGEDTYEAETEETKKKYLHQSKVDGRKKEDISSEAHRHQLQLSNHCNNKTASNEKILKEVCDKTVDIDQRLVEETIKLDNLRKQVEEINLCINEKLLLNSITPNNKFYNGELMWRVSNFTALSNESRKTNTSIYSPAFYTSQFGYKCGVRLHVSLRDGQYYLSVYFFLMNGENDDVLDWPFEGRIILAIMDYSSRTPKKHIIDMLDSNPTLPTFHRPSSHNQKSFGFTRFVLLDSVVERRNSEGLYLVNDVLCVRAKVIPRDSFTGHVSDESNFLRSGSIDSNAEKCKFQIT